MTKPLYYIAYGSNLNLAQMAYRCPTARTVGSGMLHGWRLVFSQFATIIPDGSTSVPVGVWQIDEQCERALDLYEGYPSLYRKEYIDVSVGEETITAMVYIMNTRRLSYPSANYLDCIRAGYVDFGLDSRYLDDALEYTLGTKRI